MYYYVITIMSNSSLYYSFGSIVYIHIHLKKGFILGSSLNLATLLLPITKASRVNFDVIISK
jgi:hypothetical protein